MGNGNITLCLPAALGSLTQLSRALHDFVAPLALDPALVFQVDLASCEAFTNIVKHAMNYDESQQVTVILSHDGDLLTLTLSDSGRAIPPHILREQEHAAFRAPDPRSQSSWPEGGMGMKLIRSMMDVVSYRTENGRNILILGKRLPSEHQ
jgi:serine/threonine-protein kinase RsbW